MPFIGYHPAEELPIRQTDAVEIPRGVHVRMPTHPKIDGYTTVRRQTIRVHHIMPGQSLSPMRLQDLRQQPPHAARWLEFYQQMVVCASLVRSDAPMRRAAMNLAHDFRVPVENPKLCWPGRGGYWAEVDINDVLGESKECPAFPEDYEALFIDTVLACRETA